jgi:transglutaminase-like putative cysteine protease
MIYDVRQATVYHYASPVAHAHHVLRLTPIDRPGQRVHAAALDIEPPPVERREGLDFFGNRITWVALDEPHDMLTVRVAARIAVERAAAGLPQTPPPWEDVRAAAFASADLSPKSPAHFLFPSRQVSLDPEIRNYAALSFPPGRAVLDGAVDLMNRIKAEFTYEVGATTASTTPPMSFALRRGVCQDFSHVMISGMRALGLPASYVSGYLRTGQAPGAARLEGADAMHAWVQVWCGAVAGWVGLDPTNGIPAGDDHLVLAIGRDYADVAPLDGVIFAAGGQRLEVSVLVLPVG